MSVATKRIVYAAREQGVDRLIVVSADGAGDSHPGLPPPLRIGYFFIRRYMAEKERQERIVRESGLSWTIVQPTQLTDDPPTGQVATSRIAGVRNQLSRADLAALLIDQLESREVVRQMPGLFEPGRGNSGSSGSTRT